MGGTCSVAQVGTHGDLTPSIGTAPPWALGCDYVQGVEEGLATYSQQEYLRCN